jgi:hypothetical protein
MFINFLRMINTDRNISEFWWIVSKTYNFKMNSFFGFVTLLVYYITDVNNIKTQQVLVNVLT